MSYFDQEQHFDSVKCNEERITAERNEVLVARACDGTVSRQVNFTNQDNSFCGRFNGSLSSVELSDCVVYDKDGNRISFDVPKGYQLSSVDQLSGSAEINVFQEIQNLKNAIDNLGSYFGDSGDNQSSSVSKPSFRQYVQSRFPDLNRCTIGNVTDQDMRWEIVQMMFKYMMS